MAEPRDHDAEGRDPDPGDREDLDRQWQEIIADLGPMDASGLAGEGRDALGHGEFDDPAPGPGPRDYAVEEDDGDFVPPEPPAVGSGNPAIVLSMVGVAGAPAALLLAAVFWPAVPGIVLAVLVAAFIAGAVGLFFALPRDADRDGPGDDGARV